MAREVKVSTKPVNTTLNTLSSVLEPQPVMPIVEVANTATTSSSNVTPQFQQNNTTNIGIQANNIYISGYAVPNTTSVELLNLSSPSSLSYGPIGAQEVINVGVLPNDGEGDPLRVAFQKVNNNFSNLFATTFNTTEAITSGLDPDQVIFEYPVDLFTQGSLQIRSYTPDNSDMQNIVLSAAVTNNSNNVKFTAYATTFDGNALCRYDMDVLNQSVRVLVNPIQNTTIYHFINYQVTNVGLAVSPAISPDGYPPGTVLGTEDDTILVVEGI